MKISPEIIQKLSSEDHPLWHASHADGSDNRIDGDKVLEESAYGVEFGILAAVSMGIRKLFKNRNKTRDDLQAEKEAFRINKTCVSLDEMLLEYIQAAQNGTPVDQESLGELIDTLDEMHGYYQSGKLVISGKAELSEIRKCIEAYTAEATGSRPAQQAQNPNADELALIRELLLKQKQ